MLLVEALLHGVEHAVALEALDRRDLVVRRVAASTVHDFTGSPSMSTTHMPQLEVSQPQCVPVRPSSSRRKWTSSSRGSTSRVCSSPLTESVTCTAAPQRFAAASISSATERHRVTWTFGRARVETAPARPLEIAWVASEVVAKRCSASAAGSARPEAERARVPQLDDRRPADVEAHERAAADLVDDRVGRA